MKLYMYKDVHCPIVLAGHKNYWHCREKKSSGQNSLKMGLWLLYPSLFSTPRDGNGSITMQLTAHAGELRGFKIDLPKKKRVVNTQFKIYRRHRFANFSVPSKWFESLIYDVEMLRMFCTYLQIGSAWKDDLCKSDLEKFCLNSASYLFLRISIGIFVIVSLDSFFAILFLPQ